jgi:predicted nucleotidyltransferase
MSNQTKILDSHIRHIITNITQQNFEITAIILYGSYGRNEGSWYKNKDGDYQPYNDYDILLILDKKQSTIKLNLLKKKLLEKIDIRWIDLGQKTIKELKKLRPSIFNYDLKYASKVISGQKNILENIPGIDASQLPLEEANILFRTRMWTFFGSLDENGFNSGLTGDASRFFRNQMAKAVLAVVDVCLLQKGKYHFSYKVRVKRFKKLYEYKKELNILCDWALTEKMEPKAPEMDKGDVVNLYSKIHKIFIHEMYTAIGKRFLSKINKPEKLIYLWKYYPTNAIRRIIYFLINQSTKYEETIILNMVQLHILMAYDKNKIKGKYLIKAIYLMKSIDSSVDLNSSWDKARMHVANLRLI